MFQSSVLASNNPFADLLSASDATPDSVASDDVLAEASSHAMANNPFLSALAAEECDTDEDVTAVPLKQDDPWSTHDAPGKDEYFCKTLLFMP